MLTVFMTLCEAFVRMNSGNAYRVSTGGENEKTHGLGRVKWPSFREITRIQQEPATAFASSDVFCEA